MEFREFVNNCLKLVLRSHPRPLVVGLGGGECTGKSYLAARWKELAGDDLDVIVVPMDGYLAFSRRERQNFDANSSDVSILARYIGDHPDSFDLNQLRNDLKSIAERGEWIPRQYDYERGEVVIATSAHKVPPSAIVIVEGLFALHESLHDVVDIKTFVQAPEYLLRQRYIHRHDQQNTKPLARVIDIFDRMVLPTYREFIAPSAENAEYVAHNSGSSPIVRKLSFGMLTTIKRKTTPPSPGIYRIFITHNLDKTTDFMMDTIRSVAENAHIEIIVSSPGGAATSPASDVREKISEAEALLAVVGSDTNWVSNEIGMAYALHLPLYAIRRPENMINGVMKMITSIMVADIYKKTELEEACKTAFDKLKKEIDRQRDKLPETPYPGSTISRIEWRKYYNLIQKAHRTVIGLDLMQGGYAPTLVLGISRGGIIAADVISRLARDLPLGLLEAKRREKGDEVFFEEEPLRTLLEAHCKRVEHEVRILVVDDILKSGTSLLSALRIVERVMCLLDPSTVREFSIRSLVLIQQGEPRDGRYVPDYIIEAVKEDTSVILPYGRG